MGTIIDKLKKGVFGAKEEYKGDVKEEENKDGAEKNPFAIPEKEEEIVQQIEDQIRDDKQSRARWEMEAYVNRNFIDGNQWIAFSRNEGMLKNIPIREGEKRITVNIFRGKKRGTKSLILKNDPRIHIKSGGGITATEEEVKVANLFIQKLWRDLNMREIIGTVVDYGLNSGIAPLFYDWDPDDDEFGVRLWPEDPLDSFCDAPGSGNVQDCTFYTRTFLRSLKDLWDDPLYKDRRNVFKDVKDEGRSSLSDRKNDFMLNRQGQAMTSRKDFTRKAIVRERQVKENGQIRIQTTIAGGKMIRNEVVNRDKYRVIVYRPEAEAGIWYTRAWLSDLVDPQKSVNNTATVVESWIHYVDKVKLLAHKTTKFSKRTDSFGQVIRYTGTRPPEFEQPKVLPSTVFDHQNQSMRFMEAQTVHSESLGRTEGLTSGIAIAQIQAANINNLNEPVNNLRTFLEDLIEAILELISQNFSQVKEIVLEDENGQEMKVKVVGEEAIKGNAELAAKLGTGEESNEKRDGVVRLKAFKNISVEIIPGDAFSDLMAKTDVKELFAANAVDLQTVLDTYKIGNTGEIIDRMEANKEKEKMNNPDLMIAEAENLKMIKGEKVQASPDDDFETHQPVHSALLKKAQQAGAKELVQTIVAHMQDHEAMEAYTTKQIQGAKSAMNAQPAPAPVVPPAGPGPAMPAS